MSPVALSTLLSQALVAFTIEFDNEFEHRMPHRTTVGRGEAKPQGPWLVSQVMWANAMRHLGADELSETELAARARTSKLQLNGLKRWRYLDVVDGTISATTWGRRAQKVWQPLGAEIEGRWQSRFGARTLGAIRDALGHVAAVIDLDFPDYLPITAPTQNGKLESFGPRAGTVADGLDISVLLSRALLAYTVDFERESAISLPVSADTLRVLEAAPTPLRDLSRLSGVSREAQNMATGFLARIGCVVIEPVPGGRGQAARLTEKGVRAKAKYRRVVAATDQAMADRFGAALVAGLRERLEAIASGPILQGLQPYPDGWRALAQPLAILPHYPMVLHRGGYPDGS